MPCKTFIDYDKVFNCDGTHKIDTPVVRIRIERVTISPDCVTAFTMLGDEAGETWTKKNHKKK